MKRVAACILGCRVNQSEGESFLEYFKEGGYEVVDFNQVAEVYLIHTCTVTGQADSKSRQMIRKAKNTNSDSIVVVTGCYAQTQPGVLADMPEVDIILGMKDRHRILEFVEGFQQNNIHVYNLMEERQFEELLLATPDKTRAFIKIQEGCDSYCTYCIIPIARGPVRSRGLEEILVEIQELQKEGYQEVVLTGIHTGAYGKERGHTLADLMAEILEQTSIPRIRFGSLDPNEIQEDFLKAFANPRFMPHIHLALQSGDDSILKKMKRKYDTTLYRKVVEDLRKCKGPGLSITTDVMVGFPSEEEEHHQNSIEFIRRTGIDNLHVFKYSSRKGTKAAEFPLQLSGDVKNARAKEMAQVKGEMHRQFLEAMVGTTTKVLIEKTDLQLKAEGYSDNFLRVIIPEGKSLQENTLVSVNILAVEKDYLIGEVL